MGETRALMQSAITVLAEKGHCHVPRFGSSLQCWLQLRVGSVTQDAACFETVFFSAQFQNQHWRKARSFDQSQCPSGSGRTMV